MTVNEKTNSFLIVASVFSTLTQVKPRSFKCVIMKWSSVSVSGHSLQRGLYLNAARKEKNKNTPNTVQNCLLSALLKSNKKNISLKYVYIPYIYILQRD